MTPPGDSGSISWPLPTSPQVSCPQVNSECRRNPSFTVVWTAMPNSAPAAIWVIPDKPATCTGTSLFSFASGTCAPSSLYWLPPQAHTVPSERRARLQPLPAAICVTSDRPGIRTGLSLLIGLPSPSSPSRLSPHAHTVPSEPSARLWVQPAATCVMVPLIPDTSCGLFESPAAPVPSCPKVLRPQLQTLPSEVTARLWTCPAAT